MSLLFGLSPSVYCSRAIVANDASKVRYYRPVISQANKRDQQEVLTHLATSGNESLVDALQGTEWKLDWEAFVLTHAARSANLDMVRLFAPLAPQAVGQALKLASAGRTEHHPEAVAFLIERLPQERVAYLIRAARHALGNDPSSPTELIVHPQSSKILHSLFEHVAIERVVQALANAEPTDDPVSPLQRLQEWVSSARNDLGFCMRQSKLSQPNKGPWQARAARQAPRLCADLQAMRLAGTTPTMETAPKRPRL